MVIPRLHQLGSLTPERVGCRAGCGTALFEHFDFESTEFLLVSG